MATYIDKIIIKDPNDENKMVEVTLDGKLKVEMSPATGTDGATQITGQLRENIAAVSTTGRLLVSDEAPAPPPGTDPVDVGGEVFPAKNGGYIDITYTITTDKELHLQQWSGGAECIKSKFELYYDPDGDMGVNAVLLRIAYINYANFQFDLNKSYIGDGTARMVMRATNNTASGGLGHANFLTAYEDEQESGA